MAKVGSLTNSQPSLVVGCFRTTCQQSVKFHEHWGKYNPKWTFTQHVHPSVISRTYRLRNRHGDSKHNSVYILFLSRYVYIYIYVYIFMYIYMLCIYIYMCVCVFVVPKRFAELMHIKVSNDRIFTNKIWCVPGNFREVSTRQAPV